MPDAKSSYEKHKQRAAGRQREESAKGREVGPLPKVKNPKRKARCRKSLRLFCETYFREGRFWHAWSDDHLEVIAVLEATVLKGGLFALAMPRGSGKTSLCEVAALWALLYGHRRFVALIGATGDAAVEMLDSIKLEVETNDRLAEDFPEVCHPVRKLEGQNNRSNGQTLGGARTRITWKEARVVFPTVAGSKASGARLYVAGITGRVRGMKATAAGKSVRPDLAIVDDPQTEDSAESLLQTDKRERVVKGAVKGLAGPGQTIAMVVPCTIIAPGDLSARLLDRDRNPMFRGRRFQLVRKLPADEAAWDEYARLRRAGNTDGATELYAGNRAAMDAGADVPWADRFDPECELSAVQAAMNLKIDDPIGFAAEYQNDPLKQAAAGMRELVPAALARRLTNVPRAEVPPECSTVTAFIDCGKNALWYAVSAWDQRFGGAVIDAGAWPPQNRAYFRDDDARPSLADHFATVGGKPMQTEALLYAGLKALTADLLGREYRRHGSGEASRVALCLIDRGWKKDVVHKFCRESPFAPVLRPSLGRSAGSTGSAVDEYPAKPGEQRSPPGTPGWIWGLGREGPQLGRRVMFDADVWKTFVADRLTTGPGGFGAVMLWGDKPETHQLLCDHLTAEFAGQAKTNTGYEYEKWAVKPNRDNHLFDAVVGTAVAASVAGLRWSAAAAAGEPEPKAGPRPKIVLSEVLKQRRAERAAARG